MRTIKLLLFTALFFVFPFTVHAAFSNVDGMFLLHRFDNLSSVGETNTKVYDWSVDLNSEREGELHHNGTVLSAGDPYIDTTTFQCGTGALHIPGNGNRFEIADSDHFTLTDDFTICFWVYQLDSCSDGSGQAQWFNTGTSWSDGDNMGMHALSTDECGQMHLEFEVGANHKITPNTDSDIGRNTWQHLCIQRNNTKAFWVVNGTPNTPDTTVSGTVGSKNAAWQWGYNSFGGEHPNIIIDQFVMFNRSLSGDEMLDLYNGGTCNEIANFPPEITFYNMTSSGGCTFWNTDKQTACSTTDATPTVTITTDKDATCAIGVTDVNYTTMGSSRDCSGAGTSSHTCTVISSDALSSGLRSIYISCQDVSGNENATSTSGALSVNIEAEGEESTLRAAIESGITQSLTEGYTIYTDQKVYLRDASNNQFVGTFDKIVKWADKIWAFNALSDSDSSVGGFNISPTFYTLEMNDSAGGITVDVNQLISDTK